MTGVDAWLQRARGKWKYRGAERPPFAEEPEPGQESVWDYPRPPALDLDSRQVVVRLDDTLIAQTDGAVRVLETASPPTFYLPPEDVQVDLRPDPEPGSLCEWKGRAVYWSLEVEGRILRRVAWSYPDPFQGFEAIKDYVSFYPARVECTVDGERVRPQPGGFYGGWLTDEIVGPVKGDPGTSAW